MVLKYFNSNLVSRCFDSWKNVWKEAQTEKKKDFLVIQYYQQKIIQWYLKQWKTFTKEAKSEKRRAGRAHANGAIRPHALSSDLMTRHPEFTINARPPSAES